MKFATVASLALVAAVSAQSTVDPTKLGNGWCITVKEDACRDTIVPKVCGANATFTSSCEAVFSMDKICMSFKTSCTCTPKTGGEVKDLSFEAFNETFTSMWLFFVCLCCEISVQNQIFLDRSTNSHEHAFVFLSISHALQHVR